MKLDCGWIKANRYSITPSTARFLLQVSGRGKLPLDEEAVSILQAIGLGHPVPGPIPKVPAVPTEVQERPSGPGDKVEYI